MVTNPDTDGASVIKEPIPHQKQLSQLTTKSHLNTHLLAFLTASRFVIAFLINSKFLIGTAYSPCNNRGNESTEMEINFCGSPIICVKTISFLIFAFIIQQFPGYNFHDLRYFSHYLFIN